MRKNKRRKPMGEINVVPYIDVTLVLLIIFMITTPMLQTGVEVDLPEAEVATTVEQKDGTPPIVISIKADGHYFLNVDGSTDTEVQPEEINEKVEAAVANKQTPQVLINADKTVEYGAVVTVMASLKNAGVPNVGLITKPNNE
jgi:biopolymer transport protein TolR